MSCGNYGFYGFSGITEGKQLDDFVWFYSGTLQTGDDNKIPVLTRSVNIFINKLDVNLQSAPTGQAVVVKFYKDTTLIGTVTVSAGSLVGSTNIAKTFVSAGNKMTIQITQVGSVQYGITLTAFARAAA